jgi:flagellar hook-associated protein 2
MADVTPSATASQLATAYTAAAQSLITSQTKNVQASSTALTKLQSALSAFNSALGGLSTGKGVARNTASFGQSGPATATATSTAQPGNYALFVEQVATVHQVAFEDLPAVPVALGGPLVVKLDDGTDFTVNLTLADQNGDGTISHVEIARAVNQAPDNQGKVTATTVTVGNQNQLVLSAGQSGEANQITLDTSGLPGGALKDALDAPKELSVARDAIVWLGEQGTGIRMQQASNTFTAIDGVSFTVNKAMQPGDAAAVLSIAPDDAGTVANVRSFVDAYNVLEKALDELTANGNENTQRAAFASDAGVLALRNRLANTLRQSFDGLRLGDFGIGASRDGSLTLDEAKLRKGLTAHPEGLDQVFGKTGLVDSSGALGAFQTAVRIWTDVSNGQIKQRQDSLQAQQKALTARQERLDNQYTQAYNRYLTQFTQLQALQARMSDTAGLFGSLATTSSA